MIKIIFLSLLLTLALADCSTLCATCKEQNNSYSCLSCSPDNKQIYLFSCPQPGGQLTIFYIIAAVITVLHIFMLVMGHGIYRDIFQNIQLASLVTWRYGFQKGIYAIQLTNLGMVRHNSFPDTFGGQFIVVMIFIGVYWIMLIVAFRYPHNPTAALVRRKSIIFPTRIYTFIFNMLLYSSLMQVATISTEPKLKVFAYVLAILALVKLVVVLVGLLVSSNWKRFQVDDPHYYVLLQQMTIKKWYAKNSVVISLTARGIIILAFIVLFDSPSFAGIIMVITQFLYTLYVIFFLRFTKIRYYVFIVTGNVLSIGIMLVIYMGGVSTIGGNSWDKQSFAYLSLCLALVAVFFFATMSEIIIKKQIITKDIKSFYYRFIKCDNSQEQSLITSKYDSKKRQKVTQFQTNLLYQRQIPNQSMQMSDRASK